MSDLPEAAERRIAELVQPTSGEILRAKRAVLERLGRQPERSGELEWILVDEAGVPRYNERRATLELPYPSGDPESIDPNHPLILHERLRFAARLAVAELAAEGILLGVDAPGQGHASIDIQFGNIGTGTRPAVDQATISPEGYTLARRYRSNVVAVADPDLFTAGLEGLDVDDRMALCITEALAAFRRGLWLSCVTLLGAVSEGAWFRVAERLRGRSAELDRALDDDRSAAGYVIRLTADELAKGKGQRGEIAELHAHAAYLRDLRNYGIHPRGADPGASQERAFTEEGCALLLLQTHRYLERLTAAAERAAQTAS